ncbi:GIN domain-containing protein [Rufibacter quisquiliarum]|uniref:Phage shock protein PspC (Stress-responsive transcriptional regulator) n=1 Tax=Rufibacter quisquiliarum TaxID=1549639 RepID=A0A839G8M6_9BACT|nr:DUF2807 domain-containing protein [Rufibacter quisquiliarum]MBA9075794.1 phage shock protein PspC (stress-responsive transcriptional regulator) [Rufibacter quisquiliarum]
MKKNISVNLQGMIFHVEEDGYEMLRQYLAAIKAYFSSYEGHEEIVADIESRIAEIFFSRLNPGKQVITREDVQALIAQMGTVTDFEMDEPLEEEPAPAASAAYNHTTSTGQKRLYRDVNRKVLAGVASGIANYLQVDPLWVRLAFILLVLGVPFTGGFTLFGAILYVICWIALPENEALPEIPVRKLFRDPVDKKLGGVAGGIAIYFGTDVAIIRLLFLIFFFFGIGLITYIILWIAVPEAKSITERVQMQGNPVTLSSIEASVKNNLNMQDANGQESTLAKVLLFPVRLISQIIQVLSKALHPVLTVLITLIRIFAGLLLMFIAGAFLISLLVMLIAAIGEISQPGFIHLGDLPVAEFFRGLPSWLVWAAFFAGIIPALLLFLVGVGLLTKRFYLRPTIGWSMLGIWLVAVAALATGIAFSARHFQESGEVVVEKSFPGAGYNTLELKVRDTNYDYGHHLNVQLEGYTGTDVKVIQTYKGQGLDEADAIKNAQMLSYKIVPQGDSVLRFDDAFTFKPNAIFRAQDLDIKILVPEGKNVRFSSGFANHFYGDITQGDYDADDLANNTWQIKDGRLVCLSCSVVDSTRTGTSPDSTAGTGLAANLDDELSILNDDYSGVSKIYNVSDFNEVEAGGAYHIRIKQSYRHHVRVTGSEKELDRLQIREQNGVLRIKRDNGYFKFWGMNTKAILIEIETPDLRSVDLSGAAKAEIIGFAPDNFELQQSGASQVAMAISTQNLDAELSGASQLHLKGHADQLDINASGACSINALRLTAVRANLDLSGASDAEVNVKEYLQAHASGASDVRYTGEVQQVDADKSGGSSVSRK